MDTAQFANVILQFLDRVPVQGRGERRTLAAVEETLGQMSEGKLILGVPQPTPTEPAAE